MDATAMDELVRELRQGICTVRLGANFPPDVDLAEHHAGGYRMAYVYRDGKRVESHLVTRDQAERLALYGAKRAPIDDEELELTNDTNTTADER